MLSTFLLLILCLLLFMPVIFTILNIYNLFSSKPSSQNFSIWGTLIIGYLLTGILYVTMNFKNYDEPITNEYHTILEELHAPFASQSLPVISILALSAILAFLILHYKRLTLPPLTAAILISFVYLGCYISVTALLQLLSNITFTIYGFFILLLCALPFNYLVLSITLLHELTKETWSPRPVRPVLTPFDMIDDFLKKTLSIPLLGFITLVPVIGVCIIVSVLFHQRSDELIRFVTDTSDWLFSTKQGVIITTIQDDHYLCTVAAGGHPHIVKPQRYGIRQGHRIVVNRQLCIANAFEELIAQHTPRLHHAIRRFYDAYGFPISRHIRTPLLADITYLLMKPLEWLFLLILYVFDRNPEQRIQSQYRIKR